MTLIDLLSTLKDNPYFGAGAGLIGIGTLLAVARRGSQLGLVAFRRQYMITLEIPSSDESYSWLLQWISVQLAQSSRHLSVRTQLVKNEQTNKIQATYHFMPSIGTHYFWYGRKWIKVERTREQMMNLSTGTPFESVQLTAFGKNRQIYFDMLEQAREDVLEKNIGKTPVYVPNTSQIKPLLIIVNEWRMFGHARRKRPLSSVILDQDIMSKLVDDVRQFIQNPQWYSDRGHFDMSISTLNLSEGTMTDDRLQQLLSRVPEQTVLLLEDIDAATVGRHYEKE
ncbi:unnamed protein product, partial [Didymodactylos carnosus]